MLRTSFFAATRHLRSQSHRGIPVIYLSNDYTNRHISCSGLRSDGPNSTVTVTDSATGKFKRIEPALTFEEALKL